ncbi:MAG: DUF1648 domain-containing protein [Clostridia bacterium]|nr:DUF1648 domain-containing protein [Clostridia bacterium]
MKFIKWKILIATSLVCLLPILLGIYLWNELPETIAIHFNFYNEPDTFVSKEVAVFGLPFLMMFIQVFSSVVTDLNAKKHGESKKIERVAKWIIPVMSVVLYAVTLGYALGFSIDIRKCAMIILGIVFIVLGNYMPKLDYVKNYKLDTDKARKTNRIMGFSLVIMGILGFITIFLPPVSTILWLIILIVLAMVSFVYCMMNAEK